MIRRILRAIHREVLGTPAPDTSRVAQPARPLAVMPFGDLLKGKRVLIAGAGPNIGRGIARMCGSAGADLVLTDVQRAPLEQLQTDLADLPITVQVAMSDMTSGAATLSLLDQLEASGHLPDVLVLNAGTNGEPADIGMIRMDDMERLFRANVFGHWFLADQLAARLVRLERQASFVFVTSIHQHTLRGIPAYSASKAALGMLVRELAVQYAPHGIRVNAVAPGWTALDDTQATPFHRSTPLHRSAVHPDHIGSAVLHLSSDVLSGHTTGACLTVDGGLSVQSYLTMPRG